MKITKLTLENFKGTDYDELTFGDLNAITGRNGAGKTTIADAIIFALYGTTRTGNKSVDGLLKHGKEQGSVSLVIGDHLITRTFSTFGNVLKIDGTETPDLGLSLDVHSFINIFIPGEILELSTTERRTTFINALPKLDLKAVFIEHTARPDLTERINFDFMEKSAKSLQQELKDAEVKQLATRLAKPDYSRTELERELGIADLFDQYTSKKTQLESRIQQGQTMIENLENETTCRYCGGPIKKDETKIHDHKEDLLALKTELAELKEPAAPKEPASVIRYKIQELDNYERQQQTEGADLSTEIAELNLILSEIKPGGEIAKYVTQQADEFLSESIQGIADGLKLPGEYSLKLSERLKNGNYRDIFTVTRDEKPYAELSTGEKILVDILLSLTLGSLLTEESIPLFVDDADLLSVKPQFVDQQIFFAEVTDADLQISSAQIK